MKIPNNAKKVFEGVVFDVYQWDQEMFDGTTEVYEALKRVDTTQVIALQDGKILISEEEQPNKPMFYSLLGGRQEKGENPLDSAKRELLEESGMISDQWEGYKIYQVPGKIEWTINIYIARDCKKVAEPKLDTGEKIIIKKLSFDEFIEIALSEKFRGLELTQDILKMKLDSTLMDGFRNRLS